MVPIEALVLFTNSIWREITSVMQIATVSLGWMFLVDTTIFEIYPLYKGENYKRTRKQFDVLIPNINFHFFPKGRRAKRIP